MMYGAKRKTENYLAEKQKKKKGKKKGISVPIPMYSHDNTAYNQYFFF